MSTTIDQKVVEMRFDNKQFEENVAESISTLDKLKSALNFDKVSDAFGTVTNAAAKVDLSPISNGVDTIIVKFNALELAVIQSISNIITNGIEKLEHAVTSLTLDQVTSGWNKLEQKTGSVQTIMAATGKTIDEVSEQLDRLNWFSDETSYSFTDMTSNVGKFTSVGVELEDAVAAMEGISTWAALSGANATTASRAMYNLSQAMGVGSVKLIDWRSIENAGMATSEFKSIVLDTAAAMGTLTKFADGTYQTIEKGTNVTVKDFNSALSEGWFSSEVLMKSLETYGGFANELSKATKDLGIETFDLLQAIDNYDGSAESLNKIVIKTGKSASELQPILDKLTSSEYELGRKAFKAAQEAKTFTDAIDATADAVSTKWMNVFEILFGNYEQAKGFYTDMAEALYYIFADPVDQLKDFVEKWSEFYKLTEDGERIFMGDLFRSGITDFLWGIDNVLEIIKNTLSSIIPAGTVTNFVKLTFKFSDAMKAFREGTETFELSESVISRLQRVWAGLTAVFDIFKQLLSSLKPLFKDISNVIGTLADDALSLSARFGDWLVSLADTIRENQTFQTVMQKLHDILVPVTQKISELYNKLKEKIQTKEFASLSDILGKISGHLKPVWDFVNKIFDKVQEFFNTFNITGVLSDIWGFIKNIGDSIGNLISQINLGRVFDGLESVLISIGKIMKDIFSNFSLSGLFKSLGEGITSLTSSLGKADFSNLFSTLTKGTMIFGGFNLGKLFGSASDALGGTGGIKGLLSPITDVFDALKDGISSFLGNTDEGKLKSVAIAIGILTAALFVLASVDTTKIDSGLKGIGGTLAEMLAGMFALSKMDLSNGKGMKNVATAMIEIAAAIWILSKAMTPFAEMDEGQLKKAGAALTVMLGEFLIFIAIFGDISKANTKGIFKTSNGFDKQIIKAAEAMVILGVAAKVFASAAKDFGNMDEGAIKQAGIAITVLLTEMLGFSALAGKMDSKKVSSVSASMIMLGAAMKIFASVASDFGKMDFNQVVTAVGMMTYIMIEMGLFMIAANDFVDSAGKVAAVAASMILLGIAMGTFAASLGIISLIDSNKLLGSVAAMTAVLAEMVIFMTVASALSGSTGSIAATAASMILLGLAMQSFATAGMMFSMVNWESLGKMGAVFVVIAGAMALMAPLLPTIGAGLTSIGVGLIAIGAGITLIGVGIASLSLGVLAGKIADIAARFVWLSDQLVQVGKSVKNALTMDVLIQFLTLLPKLITGVFSGIIAGIIEGVGMIVGSVGTLFDGLKELILSFLDLVKEVAPNIIDTILVVLDDVLASLTEHVPQMLSSVLTLLLKILDGLVDYVPDIVSTLVKLLTKTIDSLSDHIPELLKSVTKFLDSLFGEILKTIRELFTDVKEGNTDSMGLPKLGKELSDFWTNIKPFVDGVKDLKPQDLAAVADLAKAVLALTAANVLEGFASWMKGKDNAKEFGDSLVEFAPKLREFGAIMESSDPEVISKSAKAVAEIAKAFSSDVFKTGGLFQKVKGELGELKEVGQKLVDIAPKLREFEALMHGTDPDDLKISAKSVTTIADAFDKNTFKTNGFVQLIKGETTDLDKLGDQLVSIAPKFREFETVMKGTDPEDVKKSTESVKAIADAFDENSFKTNGLSQFLTGEVSFENMVTNLTSFGEGISSFYTSIADIDTDHITAMIDAVKDILDFTKGSGEIKATIDKSFGDSMKKIAENGINDFITVIVNSATNVQTNTKNLIDKMITAIKDKKATALNAMDAIVNGLVSTIKTKNESFKKAGQEVATSFILGIKGEMLTIYNAAKDLAMGAAATMSDQYLLFYNAGVHVMEGYIAGMQAKAELVSKKASELANVSLTAMTDVLKIESPSKAFYRIGAYAGEGFALGLESMMKPAADISSSLGDTVLTTMNDVINDFLQNDLNTEPVIHPVLDLSDIEAGSRRLDSLMSSDLAYAASNDISGSSGYYNSNTVDNSRSFGGFTFNIYPQGTNAEEIADELGDEIFRRMRIFSTI